MRLRLSLFLLTLLYLPSLPSAASSVGLDFSRGDNLAGWELRGRLDLDPKAVWQTYGSLQHTNLTVPGAQSETNQVVLGLDNAPDDVWDYSGEISFNRDPINDITSFGPGITVSFTWLRAAPEATTEVDDGTAGQDEEMAAFSPEILTCLVGLDVYNFSTSVGSGTYTYVNLAGKTHTYKANREQLDVLQAHPSAEVEVPLADGAVTPFLSGGLYGYSDDPTVLAEKLNQYFSASPSALRVNTLLNGLLLADWKAGASVPLEWDFRVEASYGRQLLFSPEEWVDLYDAKVVKKFGALRATFDAGNTIQEGAAQWVFDGGLSYRF
jgi:hypothetical protein